MARHRRAENLEEDRPELSISPLIDVCFLLLIYFLVTTTIKQKERDTNMVLPSAAPSDVQPEIRPMFIKVAENGYIYSGVGASQELLDSDPSVRTCELLDKRVRAYKDAATVGDTKPLVQIYVESKAKQQRVMDVLNVLAKYEVDKVTFTDLIDPE